MKAAYLEKTKVVSTVLQKVEWWEESMVYQKDKLRVVLLVVLSVASMVVLLAFALAVRMDNEWAVSMAD